MKEIIDKLSSYNIFNYLVPGVVFAALAEYLTQFKFIHNDIIVAAFIFYFIGMIVSRIGSLVIEPLLKWCSFLRFSDYADYITAAQKDPQIEILSESNNSYRTYCSLFMMLIFLKGYEALAENYSFFKNSSPYLLLVGILVLFLFAYRKQTRYVSERVQKTISD